MTITAKLIVLLTAATVALTLPAPAAGAEEDLAVIAPPPATPVAGAGLVGLNFATLEAAALAEAAERSRQAPPSPTSAAPLERTGGTGAPHSDAWWQGVAVCEQGGRNDPYFGYFSWMDGSAAGLTWEQQVAKSNDLLLRAGREIGPWAASCVAAGYRASPGG